MDKDSKLIFENYKKCIINEQIANPALMAGSSVASQAAAGIFGGLFVLLNDISKWAYSKSPEGIRDSIQLKFNKVNDKLHDLNSTITALDLASKDIANTTLFNQSVNKTINYILSIQTDESVNQLGQQISKVYNILQKPLINSNDIVVLEKLAAANDALTDASINFVVKLVNESNLNTKGDILKDIEGIRAESKRRNGNARQKVNQSKQMVVFSGGMPPMNPNDPEFKRIIRAKAAEAEARARSAEIDAVGKAQSLIQKARLSQAEIAKISAEGSKLSAETTNAWMSVFRVWAMLSAAVAGIVLLIGSSHHGGVGEFLKAAIHFIFKTAAGGVIEAGKGAFEGSKEGVLGAATPTPTPTPTPVPTPEATLSF